MAGYTQTARNVNNWVKNLPKYKSWETAVERLKWEYKNYANMGRVINPPVTAATVSNWFRRHTLPVQAACMLLSTLYKVKPEARNEITIFDFYPHLADLVEPKYYEE